MIRIAPKEIQQLNRLLSTNWLLATTDGNNVGLVPVNYIKRHEISQQQTGFNSTQEIQSNQNPISQLQEQPANAQAESITMKNDISIKSSEIIKDENVS